MELKAYLNPNPVLRGDTLTDPHGREYVMQNDPFLEVELCDFPETVPLLLASRRSPCKLNLFSKVSASWT